MAVLIGVSSELATLNERGVITPFLNTLERLHVLIMLRVYVISYF